MEKSRAIELLEHLAWDRDIDRNPYGDALNMAIEALKAQLSQEGATSDLISRTETVKHLRRVLDATVPITDYDEGYVDGVKFGISTVSTMPTVQPVATDIYVGDKISKFIDGLEEIFADLRERHVDDSVCGLCEYDGAYMGQSGDWCNECPGFDRDDCFKLSDETRKKWTDEIIKALPTIQPEPSIPLSWIENEIKWLKSLDNTFSEITALQISVMVKKWRDEQNETD